MHVAWDPLLVGHLEEVLRDHGVGCVVRNRYLSGGAGELPPTELWPELWVEDADYARARDILRDVLPDGEPAADWSCPGCGERIEGQFGACWHCGTAAPSGSGTGGRRR